jgi:hypothetical protein
VGGGGSWRGRGGECWLRCDAMCASRQVLSGGDEVRKSFLEAALKEFTSPLVWDIFTGGPQAD